MPKQLYIPLPCGEARQSMIERQLGPGSSVQSALSEADMRKIVEKTAGYSGMLPPQPISGCTIALRHICWHCALTNHALCGGVIARVVCLVAPSACLAISTACCRV